MRQVVVQPISKEAFAPFGDVVTAGTGVGKDANQGSAVRYDWAALLESTRSHARPNLAVFRSVPRVLPLQIVLLERHPFSTQAFLPLVCSRYLIAVAPTLASGAPDLTHVQAFVCRAGEGINYHRGVWHHPVVALDAEADLAMLAWEDGSEGDCVEFHFDEPLEIREG